MTTLGRGRPTFDDDGLLSDDVFPCRPPTREEVRQVWLDDRHHAQFARLSGAEFLNIVDEVMERYDHLKRYHEAHKLNPPRGLPVPVSNRRLYKGYAQEAKRLAKLKRHNIRA